MADHTLNELRSTVSLDLSVFLLQSVILYLPQIAFIGDGICFVSIDAHCRHWSGHPPAPRSPLFHGTLPCRSIALFFQGFCSRVSYSFHDRFLRILAFGSSSAPVRPKNIRKIQKRSGRCLANIEMSGIMVCFAT